MDEYIDPAAIEGGGEQLPAERQLISGYLGRAEAAKLRMVNQGQKPRPGEPSLADFDAFITSAQKSHELGADQLRALIKQAHRLGLY